MKFPVIFLSRITVFLLLILPGCAPLHVDPVSLSTPATAYVPRSGGSETPPSPRYLTRFAPVFLVEDNHIPHNRIGAPIAWKDQGGAVRISIDPDQAALYSEQSSFQTEKGTYTNLIYRVHFQETPATLSPFYLTSGKNLGLLVIVTINAQEQPVLITTVHTCGCYLAFTPTSFLSLEAFPEGWNQKVQEIYGESLPSMLQLKDKQTDDDRTPRVVITIRPDTHRVRGITMAVEAELTPKHQTVATPLLPMQALQTIALGETTTSFFETEGARKGYVKESFKTRERLLMSWWAMDWRIGEDKDYAPCDITGTTFYTSIKFWARDRSDMRNFPQFLQYWGWNL